MVIKLTSEKFCIETAARKRHENAIRQFFKASAGEENAEELETQIEGLARFLEQVDFQWLRSHHKELDKGGQADIELHIDFENHQYQLHFNNQQVKAPLKDQH